MSANVARARSSCALVERVDRREVVECEACKLDPPGTLRTRRRPGVLEAVSAIGPPAPRRTGRARPVGRLDQAARASSSRDRPRAPRVLLRRRSRRRARRARRAAARAASRAARPRGRPSACSPSGTARRRCSRPARSIDSRVDLLEAHVADRRAPRRARWAAVSISGATSELISVPPGRISSAARKPVSPGPAASSSTVVARLRRDRVDHPGRRPASWRGAARRRAGSQPGGLRAPAPAARAVLGWIERHRSAPRRSLPDAVRGSASDRLDRLRDLEAGEPLAAERAQLLGVERRAVAQHDARR